MSNAPYPRLLGDIGGTNARFAWQSHAGAAPSQVHGYPAAAHESLLAAMQLYLADHGLTPPPACAIGIANPIVGDRVQMTNHHWSFSISELQSALGVGRLAVINDFTALALALPALQPDELHAIGGGTVLPRAPIALLGAGTGLGVSGLLPVGRDGHVPITGEGGHVTLAPADDRESAVVERLRHRFGHASAERALSGPGLVNLYVAVCEIDGLPVQPLTPAEVIALARGEGGSADAGCATALDLFFNFLGSVAGNLALTLGARGGVYIGGGIAPRLLPEMARSGFRERFEGKGRFRDFLAGISTLVIDAEVSPAFIGASRALDMEADGS